MLLVRATARLAWSLGVPMVSIIDTAVLRTMQRRFSSPFAALPVQPREFYGSASSVPVYAHMDRYARRLAEESPELYRLFLSDADDLVGQCPPAAIGELVAHLQHLAATAP